MKEEKKDAEVQPSCLECGDRIEYGRQDKKFCCEECKNRYHNRQARRSRVFRLRVMSALEKNYRKGRKSIEMWCYDIRFTVTENVVKSISRIDPIFVSECADM